MEKHSKPELKDMTRDTPKEYNLNDPIFDNYRTRIIDSKIWRNYAGEVVSMFEPESRTRTTRVGGLSG